MEHEEAVGLREAISNRGERIVLLLEKAVGKKRFRYAVGEKEAVKECFADDGGEMGKTSFSVYAEYEDEGIHTIGSIPDFSNEATTADGFCRLLARILATPLSLDAIYEDSVTP